MSAVSGPWALVLAAGDGRRLHALTTDERGRAIPKQFCSLNGGVSLLQLAVHRAAQVAPWARITTIVAAQHERWWRDELALLPRDNVIVQPANRGTAVGVLLPLLRILDSDPRARIVLVPSDHFVADEAKLTAAMGEALAEVDRRPDGVVLLGIDPEEPDSELGWIVPAIAGRSGARPVLRFVEKPPPTLAAELMGSGGVWNSFILAADGATLLKLFERRMPSPVAVLRKALAETRKGSARSREALIEAYEGLDSFDFSRDILQGLEDRLSVLPVPRCGWSDLGTPDRVVRCIERMPSPLPVHEPAFVRDSARLDLAEATLLYRTA